MFSSLAWSRATFVFLLFSLSSSGHAREDSVFTSSVTYCNPPDTLLISRFEVAYFSHNQSVSFNVSAASVQPDVNVTANLFLNVYGMKPVNLTLDFCNILGGALCPLPQYNFTGADSITLPKSLDVASRIPAIAFKIPDLEGYAQLSLTDATTGKTRACVQATLANGWSTHQKAVEWATGGVAIAALLLSLGVSALVVDAIPTFRFLDLMSLYQTIGTSALLSLNYPSIYRAFTLNFAWTLGLFPTSESSPIQNSINRMRHLTGGRLADSSSGSAVQFVNRRLSPYNGVAAASTSLPLSDLFRREVVTSYARRFSEFAGVPTVASHLAKRETIKGEVQTVTSDSSNVLQAGLPIYVNSVNVSTSNAFMTAFFCALMLFAVGLAVLALGYGVSVLLNRRRAQTQVQTEKSSEEPPFDYLSFARSWILRLVLISCMPLLIFIFYQWTLKDSWLSIFLSVLTLVALLAAIGWPTFTTLRLAKRRGGASELYAPDEKHLLVNAPLYAQYRVQRYYFFLVTLVAMVLRAIFIAFAKNSAAAQIALIVTLEGLVVISYIVLKPYPTRGGDVYGTYLAIVRLVCSGLMIAFLPSLNVSPIPRVVIGAVIAVIFAVTVLVVIFNFFLNFFLLARSGFRRAQNVSEDSDSSSSSDRSNSRSDGSLLEKGVASPQTSDSGIDIAQTPVIRPLNPTPDHSTPLDGSVLQPFPISPTGTTVSTMEPPSLYSRDSGTLTIGSVLPRRWSFQLSHNNSPAESSVHGFGGSPRDGESMFYSGSSPGNTPEGGDSYLSSRRTSESNSPSAWKPGSRPGSSSSSGGHLTRSSSNKVIQAYQQNHDRIPEDSSS
ncbi:hypothetical protein MD484_g9067, partial [Candolleomyces efflorescens]